jgi:hypothetical protein
VSPSPPGDPGPARLTLVDPTAGAEEAAAIVAALERFVRDTAPPPAAAGSPAATEQWRVTGLLEGVEREPRSDLADPWINT